MNPDSNQAQPSVRAHMDSLSEPARTLLSDLRSFALSLGGNVIEQPRPHRIAYAKTLNLRIFLEVIPSGDRLLLTVRYGRAGPAPLSMELDASSQLEDAKKAIALAYEKIQ